MKCNLKKIKSNLVCILAPPTTFFNAEPGTPVKV